MPLSIKNPEAEQLARQLADRTGETLTDAILNSLRERMKRISGRRHTVSLEQQIEAIAKRCAALPIIDKRSEDDILGYDKKGLPR
jgi:antitoxin VapB